MTRPRTIALGTSVLGTQMANCRMNLAAMVAVACISAGTASAQAPTKVKCDKTAPTEVWVATRGSYKVTEGMGQLDERGLLRRRKVALKNGCVIDDKDILGGDTIVAFSSADSMPFDATMQCVGNKSGTELGFATGQFRDLDGSLWLLRCGNDAAEKSAECAKGLPEGKRSTVYRDRLAAKKTSANAIQIHSSSELAEYGDKLPAGDTGVYCQLYSPKKESVHLAFTYRFDDEAQKRKAQKAEKAAVPAAFNVPTKVTCSATARKLEAWRARKGEYRIPEGVSKTTLSGYLDRTRLKVANACVVEDKVSVGEELVLVTGTPKGVTWWSPDDYALQCVDTGTGESLADMRWPQEVAAGEWVLNCKHDNKDRSLPCTSHKDERSRKLAATDKYGKAKQAIATIYFDPQLLSGFKGRSAYCQMRHKASGEVDFAFRFSYP